MERDVSRWARLGDEILSWVYPSKCALCAMLAEQSPCEVCASEMDLADPDFVGEPAESPLSYRTCVFAYRGRAAHAVRRLKYSRSTSLSRFMADQVAARVQSLAHPDSIVIPVPLHRSRLALRGFNQAEACAASIQDLRLLSRSLIRTRATRPQAGLSLKEREKNLLEAFAATSDVRDQDVILIDDVVTSGHTARECARTLRAAGARTVGIVAFCGNLD